MEYINKAELLHRILNDTHGDVFDAIETIETEPTIDIVHCSECRHAKLNWADGEYYCGRHQDVFVKDCYCADGERKEDD